MSDPSDSFVDDSRGRGAAFASALERDMAHRKSVGRLQPLRKLAPFLAPYKGLIALAVLFLLLASASMLALTASGRLVIDCGFAATDAGPQYCAGFSERFGGSLSVYFALGIGMALLMAVTGAVRFYFMSLIGERVVADIRGAVYAHILKLSPAFFQRTRTGEVLSRLTTDTTLIQTVVGSSASIAVRTAINMFGALIIMAVVSWKLTLMIFVLTPLMLGPVLFFGRRLRRLSREAQDKVADVSAYAGESLAAVETVQAFTREAHDSARFSSAVEDAYKVSMRRILVRAVMSGLLYTFAFGGVISVLWFGATQVTSGAMSPGALLQFVMLATIVASGAGFLTEVWTDLLRAAGASERLAELLAETPEIAAPAHPVALPPAIKGAVAFDNVSFAYPARADMQALKDFSLHVAPGETVALVGPSGAGKSTVFQMLLRFYDPQSGTVRLDGVDLRDVAPEEVRGRLSVVQQSAPLFSGSALDNIRFGRLDASKAEAQAAARAAMADGFLSELPEGYDTDLGERAATLSGGQRQRIAIARAILRDAPVLLLDEATSALDAESERAIQDAFDDIAEGRTTLVIAHRLATVLKADRIVVMEEGRIVDEGVHAELVEKGGLYARLAELQFDLPHTAVAQ